MSLLTGQLSSSFKTIKFKDNIVLGEDKKNKKIYCVYSQDENYCFYNGNDYEEALSLYEEFSSKRRDV